METTAVLAPVCAPAERCVASLSAPSRARQHYYISINTAAAAAEAAAPVTQLVSLVICVRYNY